MFCCDVFIFDINLIKNCQMLNKYPLSSLHHNNTKIIELEAELFIIKTDLNNPQRIQYKN